MARKEARRAADRFIGIRQISFLHPRGSKVADVHVPVSPVANERTPVPTFTVPRTGVAVPPLLLSEERLLGSDNVESGWIDEPGKPQGYEETGSVSSAIPGLGFSAQSSNAPNHTYEMESDALSEVGHKGFTVDAQAMAAVLFDFATHADYRAAVKREFEGIHALFGEIDAVVTEG